MAGILVVDFFPNLVKAALRFFISGCERFVLFVVICLVLLHMGVLVDAVLYQPCDDVQLIKIADKLPVTKQDFLAIKGIGDSFITKYYDEFSNEIKNILTIIRLANNYEL